MRFICRKGFERDVHVHITIAPSAVSEGSGLEHSRVRSCFDNGSMRYNGLRLIKEISMVQCLFVFVDVPV